MLPNYSSIPHDGSVDVQREAHEEGDSFGSEHEKP